MKLIYMTNEYTMRRKPLWSRGLRNQQGRAMEESKLTLYFGCLTTKKNTPVFLNISSTIWWRKISRKIYLRWQHNANGLNQDMGFKLSYVKRSKKSRHKSMIQYISRWGIWHSPYSLCFWTHSGKKLKRGRKEQGEGEDQDVEVRLSVST